MEMFPTYDVHFYFSRWRIAVAGNIFKAYPSLADVLEAANSMEEGPGAHEDVTFDSIPAVSTVVGIDCNIH